MKNTYKFKICSLLLFTFFTSLSFGQLTTTITTGTAGTPAYNAGPIYRSSAASAYDASRYAYLYTAAELSAAGINPGDFINSLGWTKSTDASTLGGAIFRIYMKNSSAASYATATETWANLNASTTLVYENLSQTIPATQSPNYIEFTFSTPFVYTGGSLEISTEWDITGVTGNPTTNTFPWLWSTVPSSIYGTGQTTLTAAGTLSSTSNSITDITNRRPFIQIKYTPGTACTAPPTPGTTQVSSNNVCPSSPFTVSLNGASFGAGQTYQWESSADNVTYTPISGATNGSYSTTQSTDTYYRCVLTCSSISSTSTPILVTTNSFLNCYCTSSATSTSNEDIFNVSIANLNNSSTCSTTGGAGSTTNLYSNYTASVPPTDLARGVDYPFSVQVGTCGTTAFSNAVKVFIDFNQNGSFADAGETVYASATTTSGAHFENGNIVIPINAVLGNTRMRVIVAQTTPANFSSCGTYTSGETEDYIVNITAAPSCSQPNMLTVLSASSTTADVTWNVQGTETEWQLKYGPVGFNPNNSGTSVFSTTDPSIAPTTISNLTPNSFYQVYVRAICAPGDSSFYAGIASFNTYGLGQYIEANNECGPGFEDISLIGTNLNLTDDSEAGITLPFPFYYQGSIVTVGTVGNNGGIILNSQTAQVGYVMVAGTGLYPYVQDLGTPTAPAGVYTHTLGTAPNRKYIVQWEDIRHFGSTATDGATFQVVFDEASMNIYYLYEDVEMSNTLWTNGGDAEIGLRGPQNIDISLNNTAYLTDNSCVKFYYTDCPKPKNITFTNLNYDEFTVNWNVGLANETVWTLEYGPAGFTPGTGTYLNNLTTTSQIIPNLTQLTEYDVYIYAQCAVGDSSLALSGSVLTLPLCSYITNLASTVAPDSIFSTWNWTMGAAALDHFNLMYGTQGFDLYSGTLMNGTASNFADSIIDVNLMAGVKYDVYVQTVCVGGDTSAYVGPFTVTMPLTNDSTCFAENLMTDGTVYTLNVTNNASIQLNENSIAPPATGAQTTTGWGNSTISRSTWFTFQAPASGSVRISGKNVGFDGQIAVYEVGSCSDFTTFELVAANDDEIDGTSDAPNFTVCGLTPGNTYYLMHDPYSTFTSSYVYSIKISEIVLEAGLNNPTMNICSGDTLNLFETINGNDMGGVWIPTNTNVALVDDTLFSSNGLAYQTFSFQYRITDGCAYDSIVSQIKIFSPSQAGTDGGITVCRNQPINLLAGLGGTIDVGGTWYDPSNAPIATSAIVASNFPGQYNYDYITGNGVCPDDTALVIVNVQNTCNYLSLDEEALGQLNVYPNPTSGIVYISNEFSSESFSYEVFDVNGRKIDVKNNSINGKSQTKVDLSLVESGIYLIRVYNANASKTYRITVN